MATRGPFPGMDPWLQTRWGYTHTAMMTYMNLRLNKVLAAGLVSTIQERVVIETGNGGGREVVPDLIVVKYPQPVPSRGRDPDGAGDVALAEPVVVDLPVEYEQPYIEIIDTSTGGTVVTVIELISPSNKRSGAARERYLKKQEEVLSSVCNLVEIDLIRGFTDVTLASSWAEPVTKEATYHVSVRRASTPRSAEVYPMPLRSQLPSFKVPQRATDPDVRLDLQAVIDDVYRDGNCAALLNYDRPLDPPLDSDDVAWAAERVREWRAVNGGV